jgi:hypothetical protein
LRNWVSPAHLCTSGIRLLNYCKHICYMYGHAITVTLWPTWRSMKWAGLKSSGSNCPRKVFRLMRLFAGFGRLIWKARLAWRLQKALVVRNRAIRLEPSVAHLV